jgi:hypothetical protein
MGSSTNPDSPTIKLVGATADIDWPSLSRDVTYQLYSPTGGWLPVTREVYRRLTNPQTRRVLLKQERKVINSTLLDTKI